MAEIAKSYFNCGDCIHRMVCSNKEEYAMFLDETMRPDFLDIRIDRDDEEKERRCYVEYNGKKKERRCYVEYNGKKKALGYPDKYFESLSDDDLMYLTRRYFIKHLDLFE